MARIHFLFIFAALTLGFSTAYAKHHEEEAIVEDQPLQLPTYNQFRLMRPEKQEAFMADLREMLTETSTASGMEVLSFFDSLNISVTAKWASFLSLLNNPASAASDASWCGDYNFSYNYSKGQFCVKKDSIFGITQCGDNAQSYIKSCPTKYAQTRLANEDKVSNVSAAAGSSATVNQDVRKFQEEATKTQANVDTAQAAKKTPEPVDIRPQYQSKSTADTNLDKKPKKFRCIYAGFTVYGEDCKPQDKYIDPKTNTVYTCKLSEADKVEYKSVAPAKANAKKSILCNPIFFGTTEAAGKQEPICVARGKNATADCLKAANVNKEASLKSAVEFAKGDKAKYDELVQTMTTLCPSTQGFAPLTLSTVTPVMTSPRDSMSESSKKDLDATCKKYKERMFDYTLAYGGSGTSYTSPTAK